ncbi:putative polypeptide N-acetylgalactosaminyltransferase [Gregarina niphandrodes]|uniref:Polypeptide N-acetylgalactosaminyltransferase n=1 Tax=Gregarina niphandrodes TaxID=110365 RepID=A0A023B4P0_GRENI|nr:putative polypeptide N-acetylgalactosaminyltransferase [Gregarina niphandrodes]EZG57172.1 putative polypeptide N-acetylgalactosaminyltransferase [Gregarina niphandrodes]|eukprot:XP_011131077.1 putative polypeptide N-acetylgalactosaminyltransferase [Gregarina niphandrodes]
MLRSWCRRLVDRYLCVRMFTILGGSAAALVVTSNRRWQWWKWIVGLCPALAASVWLVVCRYATLSKPKMPMLLSSTVLLSVAIAITYNGLHGLWFCGQMIRTSGHDDILDNIEEHLTGGDPDGGDINGDSWARPFRKGSPGLVSEIIAIPGSVRVDSLGESLSREATRAEEGEPGNLSWENLRALFQDDRALIDSWEYRRDISVVIVVRDEDEYIVKTIQYLLDNTPAEVLKEVIVVDDASKLPVAVLLRNTLFKNGYSTRIGSNGQNSNGQNSNGQDSNGQDSNGQDSNGQDSNGQDSNGQDSNGQDADGPERNGPEPNSPRGTSTQRHFSGEQLRKMIKVLRFGIGEGLIRSKIVGADLALGSNILFLDGHCRVDPGWELGLLQVVERYGYKTIAVPQIYDIDRFTWEDKDTYGVKMMFDWTFEFDWYEDFSYDVPIMPGGIMLMTKKWWLESGKYDAGMLEWGGENIEQSLRTWLCGGGIKLAPGSIPNVAMPAVVDAPGSNESDSEPDVVGSIPGVPSSENIPLSRIGHIFDRPKKPNPGNSLVRNVQRNQKRAAIVWLDDYYQYMLKYHPIVNTLDEGNGLEYRQLIRQRLNCKPFQTFVNKFRSAFERLGLLEHDYHYLQNKSNRLCLTAVNNNGHGFTLAQLPCQRSDKYQMWANILGNRFLHNLGTKLCLTTIQPDGIGAGFTVYEQSPHETLLQECKWNRMLSSKYISYTHTFEPGIFERIPGIFEHSRV